MWKLSQKIPPQLIRAPELPITKTGHLKICLVGDSLQKGFNKQSVALILYKLQQATHVLSSDHGFGGLRVVEVTLREVWRVHLEQYWLQHLLWGFLWLHVSFFVGEFWECTFLPSPESKLARQPFWRTTRRWTSTAAWLGSSETAWSS